MTPGGAGVAQRHPDGEALERYLRTQATEFLRALRLLREAGAGDGGAGATLLRPTRRLTATLHTYGPLLTPTWSDQLRPELTWLSSTLTQEPTYTTRLNRLLQALQRLSGTTLPTQSSTGATSSAAAAGSRAAGAAPAATEAAPRRRGPTATAPPPPAQPPTSGTAHAVPPTAEAPAVPAPGAAKAAALLTRRLTLARSRAHSTALQALDSARFHALTDTIAVLASEVPLTGPARTTDLRPLAATAEERLARAIAALPPVTAPGLNPPHPQDTPWHQTRLLLRLHRYAREVIQDTDQDRDTGQDTDDNARLLTAAEALDRHRDAAEAAAEAAAAARTPRITPATAYALGVLHADQRHEVEAARYAFQQTWQTWQSRQTGQTGQTEKVTVSAR